MTLATRRLAYDFLTRRSGCAQGYSVRRTVDMAVELDDELASVLSL